jgi:phosphohistidine phosphatase
MTLHLYLLRHAKSDWGSEATDDHDRPLNRRGEKAAASVGRWLAAMDEIPDRALSSTALRARDTVERAKAAGGWTCPIELSRQLYLTSPAAVLGEIQKTEGSVARFLAVGHQPVWGALAGELIAPSGEPGREPARLQFPTAALARIDFAGESWRDAQPGRGALKWLVTPKALAALGSLDLGP